MAAPYSVRTQAGAGWSMNDRKRCGWASIDADPVMRAYHDREWGVPAHDDQKHFEFLLLEGAQAGLSWSTILHRREGYARAFRQFDPRKVAHYDARRVTQLMHDPGSFEIASRSSLRSATPGVPRSPGRVREFRHVCVEVCRGKTAPESMGRPPKNSANLQGIG